MKAAEIKKYLDEIVILVDTREQQNKHILDYFDKHNIKYEKCKLDYGDYACKIPLLTDDSFIPPGDEYNYMRKAYEELKDKYITLANLSIIERKGSLDELAHNYMSKDRERIEREFKRSMVCYEKHLMIENCGYSDILFHRYKSKGDAKAFIGTIKTFESRYNLKTCYLDKKSAAGNFIYYSLYYAVREALLGIDSIHDLIFRNE